MIALLKNNLKKEMRSYSFLIVIALCLFLGYACVPSIKDGYEIFYINGIRGIYNSAWLGSMAVMLSLLLLWLFGFYMLRDKISEDEKLKVGQIIASTSISKFKYIFIKTLSNFCVLIIIELVIIAAFIIMQLYRGENYFVNLWNYFAPFIFISIPSLMLLSSLTVLFDVVPLLKGTIGNMIYFCLWLLFSVLSLEDSNSYYDIYGLNVLCSDMVNDAINAYPNLKGSDIGASFGYYPNEHISLFEWSGLNYDFDLFKSRFMWIIIAVIIILISSLIFNRFKNSKSSSKKSIKLHIKSKDTSQIHVIDIFNTFEISSVKKLKKIQIFRLTYLELKIMLKGLSLWWYVLFIFAICASPFIPLKTSAGCLPLIMLIPIGIWSKIQTNTKNSSINDLILSSCNPLYQLFSSWICGILIGFLISAGVLFNFIYSSNTSLIVPWIIGIIFIPTLAVFLGTLTRTKKMFEIIYMLLWYFGPMNGLLFFDFLGINSDNSILYLIITILLMCISLVIKNLRNIKRI